MIRTLAPFPRPTARALLVAGRNLLVWRKLIWPSVAGLLIDPAIALFGIGLGIGSMIGDIGGMPYIVFIASGMAGYSVVMTTSFEGLYSAFTRMQIQKTWESILCAPMLLGDVFLGELLWAAAKGTISAAAMLLVVVLFGYIEWYAVLFVLPFVFMAAVAMAAFALCCNAVANSYDFFSYYFSLFLTPMVMLSGFFFPRDVLPAPLFVISEWLPLTQILLLVRPLALGMWPEHVAGPLLYLFLLTVVFAYVAYQLTYRRLVK